MSTGLKVGQQPYRTGSLVPARSDPDRFTAAVASLGLLVLVGFALGLCAWEVEAPGLLDSYVTSNTVYTLNPGTGSGRPATVAIPAGIIAAALGLGFLAWRRSAAALETLGRLSRRLAPLVLAPLLPLLWRWQLWQGEREIVFLVLSGVLVFGGQRLLRLSFSTEPVLGAWAETWGPVRALSPSGRARIRDATWWLPFTLVCLAAATFAVFFSVHTVIHHRNVLSSSMDLGLEENVVWNILHGGQFYKSSPLAGPVCSHFGFHAALLAYAIAPVYMFAQNAETMLIVQAALVGGAAIPLYLVARRYLPAWTACLIGILYVFYPPAHGSILYDFHYPPLAPFFLWFTLYFVESRRDVLAAIFLVLTCSVREDVSAGLIVVGGYLILTNRRPRAGVIVALVGAAYFIVMKGVIMPRQFSGQESFLYQYQGLIPTGEHGFGGVIKTVLGNPIFTLGTLLDREKLIYLLEIFLPLAFIPLRRPIGLLCCVPGFFFTLLSTGYRPLYQISFQYTAHWTGYLFIALIANLAWMEHQSRADDRGGGRGGVAWKRSWIVALCLAMLVTSHQLGAMMQQNTARGGFGLYHFGTTSDDLTRRQTLKVLLDKIPRKAKVVAGENIVPHLSNRADAYTLRVGVFDAEYMLFNLPPWERAPVAEALRSGTFGVVAESGAFVLARRGHPTTANASVLARAGL